MIRLKKKFFSEFAILLVIILHSGSMIQTIAPSLVYFVYGIALYATFMLGVVHKKVKLDLRIGMVYVFGTMLLQTYVTHNKYDYSGYLIYASLIVVAMFISEKYEFEEFASNYVKIMLIITTISLVGYVLANYTNILTVLPKIKNSNGVDYRVGIVFNYLEIEPERNCGIFWEPGLFVTNIVWALLAEFLVLKKQSFKHFLIFSAGIFTANSSAGFALWFACLILFTVYNNREQHYSNSIWRISNSILSSIVLIAVVLIILNFDQVLYYTGLINNPYFFKLSSQEFSESSRLLAISHNMKCFMKHPFFGQGFDMAYKTARMWCDTSTSTFFLNVFGWLGGIYTIIWGLVVFRIKSLNMYSKIVLFMIIMSILNKEPHGKIALTWIILFFLLKRLKYRKKNDEY